ncbi:MAG: helix-turn-helix transcriptional regulator, partial [Xanthomonadales bacterium]|nr:helix-turn-helix transcriptional regulator [Xanthomonadales bacterium]
MTISTDKLIQLRKDRGWSQEKLAAISGISVRTIQRA